MNDVTLKAAKIEAKRFLDRVAEMELRLKERGGTEFFGCAESGAVRRASMDLTRALARLRLRG